MKKTLFAISAIAVLLGFTACTSENETLEPQVSGKTITIKAYTEENTRTTLDGNDTDGYKVFWSTDDEIKIGGNTFTLTAGAGTTSGTFTGDELTNGTEYTAYYPADYDGENWPTAQTYTAGNITGSPMKATFTYTKDVEPSLSFKDEGGILRLNLKGEAKVTSIKIIATGLDPITLDCGSTGVELNTTTAIPFHIAVPGADGAGTAYSGLKIVMTDDAGKVCIKTAKSDITIKRSEITDISLTASSFAKLPNYLCFTAEEAGATVGMNVNGTVDPLPTLEYSTDLFTWTTFTPGTSEAITLANVGDKVYFRGNNPTGFSTSYPDCVYFDINNGKVAASGNVMSLVDPTCQTTTIPCEACFYYLFFDCDLTTAPELPATTLKANCYAGMFYNESSSSLTVAPALPAETLADECYYYMFYGCTELTTAPVLPAKTLANNCYESMFNGCTSLNSVTCLATDISATDCVTDWLYDTAASGTLTCAPGMKATWADKVNGWTVEVAPTTGTAKATINSVETDVNWVQLWKGGPKFAEKNVGATSATDQGTMMTFTDAVKTGADYVWGANWRTPSKDDMVHLMTAAMGETDDKVKCEYQEGSQNGFKFTGKEDGYTDNSVFFPTAQGGSSYWSATVYDDSKAWDMYLEYSFYDWYSFWSKDEHFNEFLVRPVLAK